MATPEAASFHLFSSLPTELRLRIWHFALGIARARILTITVGLELGQKDIEPDKECKCLASLGSSEAAASTRCPGHQLVWISCGAFMLTDSEREEEQSLIPRNVSLSCAEARREVSACYPAKLQVFRPHECLGSRLSFPWSVVRFNPRLDILRLEDVAWTYCKESKQMNDFWYPALLQFRFGHGGHGRFVSEIRQTLREVRRVAIGLNAMITPLERPSDPWDMQDDPWRVDDDSEPRKTQLWWMQRLYLVEADAVYLYDSNDAQAFHSDGQPVLHEDILSMSDAELKVAFPHSHINLKSRLEKWIKKLRAGLDGLIRDGKLFSDLVRLDQHRDDQDAWQGRVKTTLPKFGAWATESCEKDCERCLDLLEGNGSP